MTYERSLSGPGSGTYVTGQGRVYQGTASPETLPTPTKPATGTEYVWLKTDGSGHLLDILTGVAS